MITIRTSFSIGHESIKEDDIEERINFKVSQALASEIQRHNLFEINKEFHKNELGENELKVDISIHFLPDNEKNQIIGMLKIIKDQNPSIRAEVKTIHDMLVGKIKIPT